MNDAGRIWSAVQAANQAWVSGRPADVAPLFHPNMVMVAPNLQRVVRGRDAMVQSFVDYCAQVTTHAFQELDHVIDVFGDTAVCTYRFDVTYSLGDSDERHQELGQEVLTLKRGDTWQVVWRAQVPAVSEEAPG